MTKILLGLLLLIGVSHALALANAWYFTYLWFDVPMHFFGGAWAAVLFFWIFEVRQDNYLFSAPRWWSLLLTLSFVSLIGVSWEFFEFLASEAMPLQIGLLDTLKDLFVDLVGGFTAFAIQYIIAPRKAMVGSPASK